MIYETGYSVRSNGFSRRITEEERLKPQLQKNDSKKLSDTKASQGGSYAHPIIFPDWIGHFAGGAAGGLASPGPSRPGGSRT
jgi:hypothetical protein